MFVCKGLWEILRPFVTLVSNLKQALHKECLFPFSLLEFFAGALEGAIHVHAPWKKVHDFGEYQENRAITHPSLSIFLFTMCVSLSSSLLYCFFDADQGKSSEFKSQGRLSCAKMIP